MSSARQWLAGLAGSAVAVAGLQLVAAPAHAADPVTINLVGINDFHGRINASTVKWAGTVEQVKARGSADNTVFVGAGDLVGASEFASALDNDEPTIDVLNELGLDASGVGNHEFDKGWDDLKNRIIGADGSRNAAWEYLGANVYAKGTTTPVLPSYWATEIGGLDVAVIGAVTEETSSLVSPGGIADISFGPVVPALNRVAGELTDGRADNGEADVIIATVHAGAVKGAGSTYEEQVAQNGEFRDMALNLAPSIDAVFQGHTHQVYAWDAPVPGVPGKTRPLLQTGNYGDFVGNIRLQVDPATGEVTSYTKENVARSTAADADLIAAYPVVADVKATVDAALKNAAEVGNQPVGSVTADITTALPRPTDPPAAGGSGNRDDRANESTLGDLVGNALRDGLPADMGKADIGIVNPGGLRAELLFKGDSAANPANTDGVVTYAEANNVLPFVNNVSLVSLSGTALKKVLEQQWQPTGSSRPFLALGLSDNVQLTYDASAPAGSRVTSVRVDGKLLDPRATYTVSTFSFLASGGDNFTAFTSGTARDTGLVDRDLWIQYLRDHRDLAPDFARQQVGLTGAGDKVVAGSTVSLGFSKLDLTSAGSPANTQLVATGRRLDGSTLAIGSYPVTAGAATAAFDVPASLVGGTVSFVAQPSGTTVTLRVAPMAVRAIQGTGAASPLVGRTVATEGVVTAAYATGGLNGFYLQDPAGDPSDGASDALFVFGAEAAAKVHVGDSVIVSGKVSEYQGLTQLSAKAADVVVLDDDLGTVKPYAPRWTILSAESAKEAHEGELVVPTGTFTVSDNYDANAYGSFVLAAGGSPLVTPTEVADAQDAGAIAAVKEENARKRITLDDGASTNYNSGAAKSLPLPWITPTNPVRVGSRVTFHRPLVLEYRYNEWTLQPSTPVTGDGHQVATFSDTRADNAAPRAVGGDTRLATFNVLNYFPTTGEEFIDNGGTCTWYTDRAGNPITVNTCTGPNSAPGPRGAANQASFARQEAKIVEAINGLGAGVVSLEELENSVVLNKDRDFAIERLVSALNEAAGAGTWSYVPSPAADELPATSEQDVIRTGFIYKPALVEPVGASDVLVSPAFADAREPLAQAFKAAGAPDGDAFAVIVNHFKSKGSGADDGTGQGNANADRVAQAKALTAFAEEFSAERGTDKVFLTGDFNAYSMEDPVQVIEGAGYTELNGALNDGEATYSFDGMDGSLDHVFANDAARAWVTGVDVWQINAQEQVAFEYSRYNSNKTQLYAADVFRSSDHNPEIVGLDLPATPVTLAATPTTVVYGKAGQLRVKVTSEGTPLGTVTAKEGARTLGSARVHDGFAVLTLPARSLAPGRHAISLSYADARGSAATGSATVTVRKASARLAASFSRTTVRRGQPAGHLTATVSASSGVPVSGKVRLYVPGRSSVLATVRDGKATFDLGTFRVAGKRTLKLVYSGNAYLTSATVTRSLTVRR